MSGAGRPGADPVDASGLSLAIVATRWHQEITSSLLARGTAAAVACGVPDPVVARVALDARTPVGNGVLTCDTVESALDRCGLPGSHEDKGWEAVVAALDTALVLRSIRRAHQPA